MLIFFSGISTSGLFRFRIILWNYEFISTFYRTPWMGDRPIARPVTSENSTAQWNEDMHPCFEREILFIRLV